MTAVDQPDFALHLGRVGGPKIGLVPTSGAHEFQNLGAFIDEFAFGLLEPFISRHWPAYTPQHHYGLSRIPIEIWREIIADLQGHRKWLATPQFSPEQIPDGFADPLNRLTGDQLDLARRDAIAMLDVLIPWLSGWCSKVTHIYVEGV